MLVNEKDTGQFKAVFLKKFKSFCEKSPLFLSYTWIDGKIIIKDSSGNMLNELTYIVDYDFTVETNIFNIRKELTKFYPTFSTYEEESIEEIQERLADGESQEEIMLSKKKIVVSVINKVMNDSNEIIIYNYKTKETKALTLKMPVIKFIKDLYSGVISDNYEKLNDIVIASTIISSN
jgi:hypothetical protein